MIVTVGGTIPADDIAELKQLGVAEVFTPGRVDAGHHRLHPRRREGVSRRPARGRAHAGRHPIGRPIDSSVNAGKMPKRTESAQRRPHLKICVLVKEVPDAAVEKRIDPSTGRMDRIGEKNLNPYDTHAIEAAMQIKEGGAVRGRRDRRRDDGPGVRRARAAQGRVARRRPLGAPDRRRRSPAPTSPPPATRWPRRSSARAPTSSCSASSPTTASATRSAPSWPTTCRCRR